MNNQQKAAINRAAKLTKIALSKLDPLSKKKSLFWAFVWGLLFGCFGVGGYLRSWTDFFISAGIILILAIGGIGVGGILGWFICPVYAMLRVASSNQKLDAMARQQSSN